MKVTEIAFSGIPVTDVARAREFYEGLLGLTPSMNHEIDGAPGRYWIEYEIGSGTLALSNAWVPSGQSGPTVAFEVEDFEKSVAELKAAGVRLKLERKETPVCWFAVVSDPDGNEIMLHHRKPAARD
jgi:predicted enzyme related to lactoylglutathione lyase